MLDSLHQEVGATEIKIATFLIRPNSLLEKVCMHSFKSSNIVGHFQRWAANSYPPAQQGCHGLRPRNLSSDTLWRYALVRVTTARWSPITQYIVFYPDLLAVGGCTHDMCATEIKIATFLIR